MVMPDAETTSWLSHTATGAACLIAGRLLTFVDQWRSRSATTAQQAASAETDRDARRDAQLLRVIDQKTDDYTRLLVRVEALEVRVESLHAEHTECERVQGELRGEITLLRSRLLDRTGEHRPPAG